jgi:acid phosphatase type 7
MKRVLFRIGTVLLALWTIVFFGKAQGHSRIPLGDSLTPVIAAAGDISCDPTKGNFGLPNGPNPASCQMGATASLISSDPTIERVLALGDNQYMDGTLSKYLASYDKTWGAFKSITSPSPGNHEWATGNDSGYLSYFGLTSPTWYSFDLGDWHIVSLDSNCNTIGGCSATSPEGAFLSNDLHSDTHLCQLLYWHVPRFSSSHKGLGFGAFWTIANKDGVDVILNGHAHSYERFAPQTTSGVADPKGIREFVVGTGGFNHGTEGILYPKATSEVFDNTTFGVLKMTLRSTGYDWQFVPVPGGTFTDAGSGTCH